MPTSRDSANEEGVYGRSITYRSHSPFSTRRFLISAWICSFGCDPDLCSAAMARTG